MSTQGSAEVRGWLSRVFQNELPLTHAVASLENDPLIELRKSRENGRYTVSAAYFIIVDVY